MLGSSHATSGLVTGAAGAELVLHLPLGGTVALSVLTAAWATMPDLDTAHSCAARSLGFLSEAFAWVVEHISGGHRHASHSILGVAVLTGITWAACHWRETWPGRIGLFLLLAVALAAGFRALRIGGHFGDVLALGAAAGVTYTGWGLALVPLACALGCSTHIAGDALTDSGVPLLWPVNDYRFKLWPEPFAFTTGTRPESAVAFVLVLMLGALAFHLTRIPIP